MLQENVKKKVYLLNATDKGKEIFFSDCQTKRENKIFTECHREGTRRSQFNKCHRKMKGNCFNVKININTWNTVMT